VVKTGKTPVFDAKEWRTLLDSIPTETVRDLRDRALIATLTYSFARITAALTMKVEDLVPEGAGWQLRLHEKGGKHHVMPCHHALAEALRAYIDDAGIAEDCKGFLFFAVFIITEADAAAIRAIFDQEGELSAAMSCAGGFPESPTMRRRGPAPGLSPGGHRCRPGLAP
jgi:integrase